MGAQAERQGIPTRNFPNRPTHVCFVSEYMRGFTSMRGSPSSPRRSFTEACQSRTSTSLSSGARRSRTGLRLLYVGQLSEDRGLHTVVEAIGRLNRTLRRWCG